MGALAASVYLLTCCRPTLKSSFCYYVETPKFINLNFYQNNFFGESSNCSYHEKLYDHSISIYNTCTDYRAWSLDDGQRRRHFYDIISRHIPHCGEEKHSKEENENKNDIPKEPEKQKEQKEQKVVSIALSEKSIIKEKLPELKLPKSPPPQKKEPEKLEKIQEVSAIITPNEVINTTPVEDISIPPIPPPVGDSTTLTDEILEQLDCNLSNLESTFDRFVCKNRDFIQNLIESLNFEKQRQEELKRNHCKIKQENDILRSKNEYLMMVNAKQVEFFKNELDKAISENKTCFLKKVQHLERVINCNKEELQYYKKNESMLLKKIENEKIELHKLKDEIDNLKCKEANIVKQYIKLLNFLIDVKKSLNSCGDGKDDSHLQRSSHTISNSSGGVSKLDEVLRSALYNGIESLNVRDLSILHDCVQDLNERLCHQNDFCGRNPVSMNISQQLYYEGYDKCPSSDYIHKGVQDYESSLSIVPSRQGPDRTTGYCPPR